MDTRTLNQKLQQILARPAPEAGLTRLPGLGILSFTMGHKIRSVSLPQSAVIFVLDGAKTIFCGQDSMRIRAGEGFLLPARMETTVGKHARRPFRSIFRLMSDLRGSHDRPRRDRAPTQQWLPHPTARSTANPL